MNALNLFDSETLALWMRTLGHFLWQGAAIGALAASALIVIGRKRPEARYGVCMAALIAMTICPPATFAWLNATAPATATPPASSEVVALADSPVMTYATYEPSTPPAAAAQTSTFDFASLVPYAFLSYCAGVLLLLSRLGFGLRGGRSLCRDSQPVKAFGVLDAVERCARQLGMTAAPAVRMCQRVAVPCVVGVVKPTILLPIALASGMAPRQIEMLLLHELLHIRRHDHLFNLFQRIVEAALFFHPAVWLLSRQASIEREHCCDDAVVALGADRAAYADSLVRAAEMRQAILAASAATPATVALGAIGAHSLLGKRVLRLLGETNASPVRIRSSWGVAAAFVAVLVAGSIYVARPSEAQNEATVAVESSKAAEEIALEEAKSPELATIIYDFARGDATKAQDVVDAISIVHKAQAGQRPDAEADIILEDGALIVRSTADVLEALEAALAKQAETSKPVLIAAAAAAEDKPLERTAVAPKHRFAIELEKGSDSALIVHYGSKGKDSSGKSDTDTLTSTISGLSDTVRSIAVRRGFKLSDPDVELEIDASLDPNKPVMDAIMKLRKDEKIATLTIRDEKGIVARIVERAPENRSIERTEVRTIEDGVETVETREFEVRPGDAPARRETRVEIKERSAEDRESAKRRVELDRQKLRTTEERLANLKQDLGRIEQRVGAGQATESEGNEARMQIARAEMALAEARFQLAEDEDKASDRSEADRQVNSAKRRVDLGRSRVSALERRFALSKRNLENAETKVKAGVATASDLSKVREMLSQAELDLTEARLQLEEDTAKAQKAGRAPATQDRTVRIERRESEDVRSVPKEIEVRARAEMNERTSAANKIEANLDRQRRLLKDAEAAKAPNLDAIRREVENAERLAKQELEKAKAYSSKVVDEQRAAAEKQIEENQIRVRELDKTLKRSQAIGPEERKLIERIQTEARPKESELEARDPKTRAAIDERRLVVAKEQVGRVRKIVESAKAARSAGKGTEESVLRAEMELAEAEFKLFEAEQLAAESKAKLKSEKTVEKTESALPNRYAEQASDYYAKIRDESDKAAKDAKKAEDRSEALRYVERARQADPVSGVGIAIELNAQGELMVREVVDGSSAAAAGMRAGDRIVSIDGKMPPKSIDDAAKMIRGPEASIVKIGFERRESDGPRTRTVELMRKLLPVERNVPKVIRIEPGAAVEPKAGASSAEADKIDELFKVINLHHAQAKDVVASLRQSFGNDLMVRSKMTPGIDNATAAWPRIPDVRLELFGDLNAVVVRHHNPADLQQVLDRIELLDRPKSDDLTEVLPLTEENEQFGRDLDVFIRQFEPAPAPAQEGN